MKESNKAIATIADYFVKKLTYSIPEITFNGNMSQKAPGIPLGLMGVGNTKKAETLQIVASLLF